MSFDKENIKAMCKDALTWATVNIKGLIMFGLGLILLWYTYRIFLYFILFTLGAVLSYVGLRELKVTLLVEFFDKVINKIRNLCCGPK